MRIAAWLCAVVVAGLGRGVRRQELRDRDRSPETGAHSVSTRGSDDVHRRERERARCTSSPRGASPRPCCTRSATSRCWRSAPSATRCSRLASATFGPAAAKAYGSSHDVPVVFAGHMKVSNVRASGGTCRRSASRTSKRRWRWTSASRCTRPARGGTIWRSGAAASEKVGGLAIVGGEPSFSATDPAAAYGRLVDRLLAVVTQDLYPTYERR